MILSGTHVGWIGILDISNQKYNTLIRSHIAKITGINLSLNYIISCS